MALARIERKTGFIHWALVAFFLTTTLYACWKMNDSYPSFFDPTKAHLLAKITIHFHKIETIENKQHFHVSFHQPLIAAFESVFVNPLVSIGNSNPYTSFNTVLLYDYGEEDNKIQVDSETHLPLFTEDMKNSGTLHEFSFHVSTLFGLVELPIYGDGLMLQPCLYFFKTSSGRYVNIVNMFRDEAKKFQIVDSKIHLQQWMKKVFENLKMLRLYFLRKHLSWLDEYALFSDLQEWTSRSGDDNGIHILCTLVLRDLVHKYKTIPKNTPLSRLLSYN